MAAFGGWDGKRVLWTGFGLVIAALIGLALFEYRGTLLFAIFIYYAIRPLYRQLDRIIDHPNVTATATILFIVIPMVAVVVYAGVVALQEVNQLLASSSFEAYRSFLQPYLRLVREGNIDKLQNTLTSASGNSITDVLRRGVPGALKRLQSITAFALSVLIRFFLMLTFLFYFLRDDQKLRRWFYESVDYEDEIVSFIKSVDSDLETIFLGNLAVVGVAAVTATITYTGLNYFASKGPIVATPVLLSLLIGIGTLVPAVGMKIVYLPYGLILFGFALTTPTPLWHPIAFLVLTFVIIDTIPDFFARAYLSARSGVHMGLVFLGYFLGTFAFGWYGLFLGPIIVVLAVHFAHMIFPGLVSDLLGE